MNHASSSSKKPVTYRHLDETVVDALMGKLRERESLDAEDCDNLLGVVETWAHLTEVAAGKTASIDDVRRILGIRFPRRKRATKTAEETGDEGPDVSGTEGGQEEPRHADNAQEDADAKVDSVAVPITQNPLDISRDPHGRRSADAFDNLHVAHHHHTMLSAGDDCPQCARGRLCKFHRPSCFTTISGRSPLVATRHTQDVLQCNLCKATFKAPLPADLEQDGISGRVLYSFSAIAMVCIYRFFGGMPMHRQETLQKALGVPVPDASMWDMCERLANVLAPIRRHLQTLAADAPLFHGDDTGATILDARKKVKTSRTTGKPTTRTGCHTTGIIAVVEDGRAILMFFTGIHHTGEVMDAVLDGRSNGLPAPIFMGDGIKSNTVTAAVVLYAGCNAHAVRRFKELLDDSPEHAEYVLERYRQIYANEDHCIEAGLDPQQRRDYHRENSRPLLREITEYGEDQFERRTVEPNSKLGKAFDYVIENERRLSAFARHPGAPIDNNRCERALRIYVRLRETAHFFRNTIGSGVADTVLTVGGSAMASSVNLFDYFVTAQRHAEDVRQHPDLWVPWRYKDRAAQLTGVDPPTTGPGAMSFAPI